MKRSKKKIKKEKLVIKNKTQHKLDYENYIKSPAWNLKKEETYKLFGKQCKKCKSDKQLHVHHMTYDRLFDEDVKKDLVVLCKTCHFEYHKLVAFTTIKKTRDFIKGKLEKENFVKKGSIFHEQNKKKGRTITVTSYLNKDKKSTFDTSVADGIRRRRMSASERQRKYENSTNRFKSSYISKQDIKKQDTERVNNLKRMLAKGSITQEYYNLKINK